VKRGVATGLGFLLVTAAALFLAWAVDWLAGFLAGFYDFTALLVCIIVSAVSAMALLAATLLLTLVFAVTVAKLGPLDKGPALGGYLGLLLLGGTYVSIGVMASSFTRNQVVALIIAFGICFALFLFGKILPFVPEKLQFIVAFLSTDTHFENVSRGVIDTRDLVYYASVIAVTLLIATTSLESRKWK